jgi:hypothetical protein
MPNSDQETAPFIDQSHNTSRPTIASQNSFSKRFSLMKRGYAEFREIAAPRIYGE